MEEGTIARWAKSVGDPVAVGEILCEIETDKAVMDYEAYEAGILTHIVVAEGETASIGAVIARLDGEATETSPPAPAPSPDAGATAAPVKEAPEPDGPAPSAPTPPPVAEDLEAKSTKPPSPDGEKRVGSPLVRRLARENNLDLAAVKGSGPDGRIVRHDIEGLLHETTSDEKGTQVDALSASRRVIARRLSETTSVPTFYVTRVARADELVRLRAAVNADLAVTQRGKISITDVLVRAVALALLEHPLVNASWGEEALETHAKVNVGVAVDSSRGLVVPVIRDANKKSVAEIATELRALVESANTKGLRLEEMSGGTFSLSNLGAFGVHEFTAVLNPPEAAILALGALERVPVVERLEGQEHIVVGTTLSYTLTCDHRVIDGAEAARFLGTLTDLVEHPGAILA
jgi:pyruvate dehydrogenase E2 component (dihydrolipoamide acetyltransferase)